MGPDPFNMPAFGSTPNPGARLQQDINTLAPLATQYSGAQNGVNIAQFTPTVTPPGQSGLAKFGHFLGGVGSEVGHIAVGVGKWLGSQVAQGAEAPFKFGNALGHAWLDNSDANQINSQSTQLSDQIDTLNSQYKQGQISHKQYQLGLKDINQNLTSLTRQGTSLDNRVKADQTQAYTSGIQTAADVLTIITAGFGKVGDAAITAGGLQPIDNLGARTTADYLMSTNANAFLSAVENNVSRIASDPELFARLSPLAQRAIETGTAEVVSQAGTMTAGQIARATAVNIALKYPIYYQAFSSTGTQLYKELDQAKYGDLVRTSAFNAALLLSGGPIGHALELLGEGATALKFGVFGQSSFLDEVSKGVGNGLPSGLYDAIMSLPVSDRADVIKQVSTVEATNMAAMGKDPVAAAWRVLDGMASYEGASMSVFSHEEALHNMVTFAKAQRLIDTTAKEFGMEGITVGRVDARALKGISSDLSNASDTEGRLKLWEQMKSNSPTQAWANNDSFDRQIKALINKHSDMESLSSAIQEIKASFTVRGFPEDAAAKASKMGYIPIKPVNLEAPFTEGTGNLVTKFSDSNDFFTHAVQPLPVLDHLGNMLTSMGLSPDASTQRVYEVFNANVAKSLSNLSSFNSIKSKLQARTAESAAKVAAPDASGFSKDELALMKKQGVTPELMAKGKITGAETSAEVTPVAAKAEVPAEEAPLQTSDYILKKLSDYAHDLSGRKLPVKAPITDLRLMTTQDFSKALEISLSDAREVKGALMDSMLQVPLQIRGLGDKIVDLNYKINPLARRYARIQGAFRFAWNPFFQAKLATKTEFLAQMLGGGWIASVFAGDYGKLDNVANSLRTAGIFEKKAEFTSVVGGEGVAEGSAVGANLTHRLLGVQEKSIAGLVQTQADKAGMDAESFIKAYPNQVRDTVQAIAQYDRNSSLLNSPLVRTLNLAFFPARFELKVAQIMARGLSAASPMTQVAVIKGLYSASTWLKSQEGQAWYSQNAEVIGLFKYFSPLASLTSVQEALTGISHHNLQESLGAFELGGLPFGWIPQLLDAEGLTHFGQSYVNPKTGAVALDYVPVSARGQLQTAISDLLSSVFTYPGATAGLPSKGTITRWAAAAITGGKSKSDFTTSTPALSPQQQSFQQTVQQLAGTKPTAPATPVPPPTQPIKVPPEPSAVLTPLPKPTSTSSGRKKKAQFAPELLPGQTSLGQLP